MNRKNSRRIGAQFERDMKNWLKRWWPEAARSYGQSRCGSDAADVEHTPYWVECKCYQTISDNALNVVYQKAFVETGIRPVLIIYKNKSKGKCGRGGYSYIRAITHIEPLKILERKADYSDMSEHRHLGYKVSLVEITIDYLGFLFDLVYGSKEEEIK
jgi:hypothetical protein